MPECPVCGSELSGGACRYCESSALIQRAYLELSQVQGRRINVDKALAMVSRARELLEERDYESVGDFLEGARAQASEAESVQAPMRKALDRASEGIRALKRSGRDTHRLEQAVKRAERFLADGDFEGARLLVKRIPAFIRELQGPPVTSTVTAPRPLSSCPSCSKHVMKSWRKCPHCLTPLPRGPSAQPPRA